MLLKNAKLILDIFEAAAGSRMMCNYHRFGGVSRDLPDGVLEKIKGLVEDRLPRKTDEFDRFLTENEVLLSRTRDVKVINRGRRGQVFDHRSGTRAPQAFHTISDTPSRMVFMIASTLKWLCAITAIFMITISSASTRIRQSIRILQQAVKQIPEGPINSQKPQYQVRVPAGEAYGRIEAPKGELGYYIISTGKPNPWRYHVRAPSFVNITALEKMCVGTKIADFVVILGVINIVLGELDR